MKLLSPAWIVQIAPQEGYTAAGSTNVWQYSQSRGLGIFHAIRILRQLIGKQRQRFRVRKTVGRCQLSAGNAPFPEPDLSRDVHQRCERVQFHVDLEVVSSAVPASWRVI